MSLRHPIKQYGDYRQYSYPLSAELRVRELEARVAHLKAENAELKETVAQLEAVKQFLLRSYIERVRKVPLPPLSSLPPIGGSLESSASPQH
jgi:uncharacterized coiled-coil protein SlyX